MKLLALLALAVLGETTDVPGNQTETTAAVGTTEAVKSTVAPQPDEPTTEPATQSTSTTTTTKATTKTPSVDPVPTGDDGIVRVKDQNQTCAMLQFEGTFTLDQINGTISSNSSELMPGSTCSTPIIQSNDALLTFEFNSTTIANGNQNSTIWEIISILFEYDNVKYAGNVEGMQAHAGSSYSCQTGFNTTLDASDLNNATYSLTLTHVRLQFAVEDVAPITGEGFAKAESCAADMEQSLLVPIVVACALAGLVLAICVAYIIGRRRTYSGYAAM